MFGELGKEISEHKGVFWAGWVVGVIIILLILWVFGWIRAENLSPNGLDPMSAKLLAYHERADPRDSTRAKAENLVSGSENPKLVSMLYK